jgi:hypothetical protein
MTPTAEETLILQLHQGRAALAERNIKQAAIIGCIFAEQDAWRLATVDARSAIPDFQRDVLAQAPNAQKAGFWRMAKIADHVRRHASGKERALLAGQPFDDIMKLAEGEIPFFHHDLEIYGAHFELMAKLAYRRPKKAFKAMQLAAWCHHPRDMKDLPALFASPRKKAKTPQPHIV